jgi:hypothetical protein
LLDDPDLCQRWREAASQDLHRHRVERVVSDVMDVYRD